VISEFDREKEAYFNLFLEQTFKNKIPITVNFKINDNRLFDKFDSGQKTLMHLKEVEFE
jgi:hypothetical protein